MKKDLWISMIEIITYTLIIFNINIFLTLLFKLLNIPIIVSGATGIVIYILFIIIVYAGTFLTKGKIVLSTDRSKDPSDKLTAMIFFGLTYLVGIFFENIFII